MDTTQTLTGDRTNPVQVGASVTTGLFAVLIAISGVLYLVGPPPIVAAIRNLGYPDYVRPLRSEEHTSELQSPCNLVCRLLLEKKKIQAAEADHRCPRATFRPRASLRVRYQA